jgi:hypothetical protein
LIECRRLFFGNKSLIHCRRKCGGIHFERTIESTAAGQIAAVIESSQRVI